MAQKGSHRQKHKQSAPTAPATDTSTDSSPIFFHKEWDDFGFMSNFYRTHFTAPNPSEVIFGLRADVTSTEVNDPNQKLAIPFQSSEQYYIYCKALCFRDSDAAALILGAKSPTACKGIGRAVKAFSEEVWSAQDLKIRVMEEALWWKFGGGQLEKLIAQADTGWLNKEARMGHLNGMGRRLLATNDRLLIEAAGQDRYWGIGYGIKQNPQLYEKSWGRNQLGKSLMATRARLRRLIAGEGEGEAKEAA